MYLLLKMGNIPSNYVSLLEGKWSLVSLAARCYSHWSCGQGTRGSWGWVFHMGGGLICREEKPAPPFRFRGAKVYQSVRYIPEKSIHCFLKNMYLRVGPPLTCLGYGAQTIISHTCMRRNLYSFLFQKRSIFTQK